ncbi:MAG: cell surface protein SprA, partial [Bacteroidales bacterium]|nr:cell surface protein SprA [Bacteroidales bacterium]
MSVLNLAYYPKEKGPYNFDTQLDPNGYLRDPQTRWGGIMREITTSDFETANVGFIEFWLMDPFWMDTVARPEKGGDLYFNLGEVSEDILKDSKKAFENGLPTSAEDAAEGKGVTKTIWGNVPTSPSYVPSFNTDPESRQFQDVGLDGIRDEEEATYFADYLNALPEQARSRYAEDPSNDNFKYFLDGDYNQSETDVLGRYKNYNGLEGNSAVREQTGDYAAQSNRPDAEDINRDNTLNETETYYSYRVRLNPEELNVGENFVVAKIPGDNNVNWYQFRIPVTDFDSKVGNIEDFKSIRFVRMYLTNFSDSVILRFAELRLIRNEWRKYDFDVSEGGPSVTQQFEPGSFEISAVNIEENSDRYVLPPKIDRVIDPSQPQLAQLNEQSMVMKVYNLKDGESRVAYKNSELDLRQYKKITMWVHAEAIQEQILDSADLTAFVRIGADYKDNFYEYEIPLKVSQTDGIKLNNESE